MKLSNSSLEINYEIKVKSNDCILYGDEEKSSIQLIIYGDSGSSGPIDFRTDENDTKKYDGQSITFKKKAFDAGKVGISRNENSR